MTNETAKSATVARVDCVCLTPLLGCLILS